MARRGDRADGRLRPASIRPTGLRWSRAHYHGGVASHLGDSNRGLASSLHAHPAWRDTTVRNSRYRGSRARRADYACGMFCGASFQAAFDCCRTCRLRTPPSSPWQAAVDALSTPSLAIPMRTSERCCGSSSTPRDLRFVAGSDADRRQRATGDRRQPHRRQNSSGAMETRPPPMTCAQLGSSPPDRARPSQRTLRSLRPRARPPHREAVADADVIAA
jgi:hypothetical protein